VLNDGGVTNMHWNYIESGLGSPPFVGPPNVSITGLI
jgi:hypothetical protein